ncbi:MAG: leucine-rich repeat domain-containing protein [Candidatus Heimdallarchaeota archaeon]
MSEPIEISIWDVPHVEHKRRVYYIVNTSKIKRGNDYIFTDIDSDDYLDIVEEIQWDQLYIKGVSDIKEIKGLNSLTFLKKLELTNGKIIRVNSLANLVNLKMLNLSNNLIVDLFGLEGLEKLEVLNLSNNKINAVPSLKALLRLKELYLDNNQIIELNGMDLPNKLEKLSIKGNENISFINFENFQDLLT